MTVRTVGPTQVQGCTQQLRATGAVCASSLGIPRSNRCSSSRRQQWQQRRLPWQQSLQISVLDHPRLCSSSTYSSRPCLQQLCTAPGHPCHRSTPNNSSSNNSRGLRPCQQPCSSSCTSCRCSLRRQKQQQQLAATCVHPARQASTTGPRTNAPAAAAPAAVRQPTAAAAAAPTPSCAR